MFLILPIVFKLKKRVIHVFGLILVLITLPSTLFGYQSADSLSLDQTLTGFSESSLDWGDYDKDGDLDLVISGTTSSGVRTQLFDNNGSGSFSLNVAASDTLKDLRLGDVAWGDYDNDGFLDLIVTGTIEGGFNSQSYLYNNSGNGTFTTATASDSLFGAVYSGVDWGDFDNDGDLDVIIVGQSSSDFSGYSNLYINNGNGSFSSSVASSTFEGVKYGAVEFSDYDKDGDLDIVLMGESNSNSQIANVYQNNGDGTFNLNSSASTVLSGAKFGNLNWGDYNNDTYPDLVITGDSGSGLYLANIYENNGSGSFTLNTDASDTLVGVNFSSVEWGDINNDGYLDLAITGTKNFPLEEISRVYLNNGDETFVTSSQIGDITSGDLGFADYDSDGDLDLVITGSTDVGDTTAIFSNNWLTANNLPGTPSGLSLVVNGDTLNFSWNAATDTESGSLSYNLFVENSTNSSSIKPGLSDTTSGFYRLSEQGNIGFGTAFSLIDSSIADGNYRWGVQAIDGANAAGLFTKSGFMINNVAPVAPQNVVATSGRNEITLNWDANTETDLSLYYIYQDTVSNLSPTNVIDSTSSNNYSVTDILLDSTYYYRLRAKDTAGNLSPFSQEVIGVALPDEVLADTSLTGLYYSDSDWGDFDNDGDLDFLISGTASGSSGSTILYENKGDINGDSDIEFEILTTSFTDVFYSSVAWGDYNNDGFLDVIISGQTTTSSSTSVTNLYKNNGDQTFTLNSTASNILTSVTQGSTIWGDVNNDGYLDLVVSGFSNSGRKTSVYINNGDESFSVGQELTGVHQSSLSMADYDNDGDLDLMVTGNSGSFFGELYNNTSGVFSLASASLGTERSVLNGYTDWGDYDNDGDLDLFISGGSSTGPVANLFINNDGVFVKDATNSATLTDLENGSSAFGDFDNDGDLDLIISGTSGGSRMAKLYTNNSATFSEYVNSPIEGTAVGSLRWVDYDNDGNLDLSQTGYGVSNPITRLYKFTPEEKGQIPSVPQNLSSAFNASNDTLSLSWDYIDTNFDSALSYNIFIKETDNSDGVTDTLSAPMSDLGTGYRRISAVGNAGIRTEYKIATKDLRVGTYDWGVQGVGANLVAGNFATANINIAIENVLPPSPKNLMIEGPHDSLSLSWDSVDEDSISYVVYRDVESTTSPIAIDTVSTNSVLLTGLSNNVTYYFYVTAIESLGYESILSNEVSILIDLNAPDAPTGLTAVSGRNEVDLMWDANSESDAVYYTIYQDTVSNSAPTHVVDTTSSTSYTVTDLTSDSTYYYYVTVIDTAGNESAISAEVIAVPIPSILSEQTDISSTFDGNYYSNSEWGDYDNDGDLDLLILGSLGAFLYKNLGNDEFESVSNSFISGVYTDFEWGDYDNDGDLDVIIASVNYTRLYRNDGNDSFTYVQGFYRAAYGSVSWGDFDNDGDLDFLLSGGISTSTNSAESSIYENNGNGSFSRNHVASGTLLGAMYGTSKWADINNDGYLDIVIAGRRYSSYYTRAYLNNGDKTFSYKQNIQNLWYADIELGDIDNDGDLDLALNGLTSGSTGTRISRMYKNDGTGIFTQYYSLNSSYDGDIELVDYDNDGDLDFTLSGRFTSTNIYANDGAGNWTLDIELPTYEFGSMAWGDYNADGDVDLVISGRSNNEYKTTLYKNTPDLTGTTPSIPVSLIDSSALGKQVLSWDASTDSEPGPISYNVSVYNETTSSFISSAMSDTVTGFRYVQREGNAGSKTTYELDYSALTSGTYTWKVQAIDGSAKASDFNTGSFTLSDNPFGLSYNPTPGLTTIEWNKLEENQVDFYSIYQETDSTVVPSLADFTATERFLSLEALSPDTTYYFYVTSTNLSGQESGFSERLTVNSEAAILLVDSENIINGYSDAESEWIDVDNDGDLDLAVTGVSTSGYVISIYINESGFSESNKVSITNTNKETSWADYDNDGDLDVIFGGGSTTQLYVNEGVNGFVRDTQTPFGSSTNGDIISGDYDADGDIDVLYTAYINGTSYLYLYQNDGSGNFTQSSASSSIKSTYSGGLNWGDVNNDGYLDVLVSGYNRVNNVNTILTELYMNDGSGGFSLSAASDTLAKVYLSSAEFGDTDGDGDLDLFITGRTQSGISQSELYINDGTGHFTTSNEDLLAIYNGHANWVDYDNDDDLDLLIAGYDSPGSGQPIVIRTKLYTNDGLGGFTESGLVLENLSIGDASWGDYDSDGDLDIILFGTNNVGTRKSIFYKNVASQGNGTDITAPVNLRTSISGNKLSLFWDRPAGYDNEVLTYNVYIINSDSSNADTLGSPMASSLSGLRKTVRSGNSGSSTKYVINTNELTEGRYYWGVQTINARYNGGSFSSASNLAFSNQVIAFNADGIFGYKDTTYTFDDSFIVLSEYYQDSTLTISASYESTGTLFLDKNGNNVYDETDIGLKDSTVNFPFQVGDSLRYYASSLGIDSLTINLGGLTSNQLNPVSFGLAIMEATPEISGNTNENGWYLLANPFNTTIGNLTSEIWTQGAINSNALTGATTLYRFVEDSARYIPVTGDINADTLKAGEGLLAYIFEDDTPADQSEVNGGWPKTLNNFGNPFGDQLSLPIKNIDVDNSGSTTDFEGLKLFGNPFGWPISVDSVITELVNIDVLANRYIYRWDPINKRYDLNATGSIKPYESVFIRTITHGLDDNIILEYDDLYEEVAPKRIKDNTLKLMLSDASGDIQSESSLLFKEESAEGIDPYDGYYLGSFASTYANLFTQVSDQPLVINSLPLSMEEEVRYPLYLDATTTGEFQLRWDKELIPENVSTLLLEYAETGEQTDMTDSEQFTFTYAPNKGKVAMLDTTVVIRSFSAPENKLKVITKADETPTFWLTVKTGKSVSNENDLGIPTEVELEQNYPNPFNPSSVIRFGVPEQAPVQLEVFDILGRKVMSLLNGEVKQPGRYNIAFDGRALASGMYIYRLVIGDKVLTKKMTLIK